MRAEKKIIVKELIDEMSSANPLVFTDYSKVKAIEANKLRNQLRVVNSNYRVVQNTLFLKALESLGSREKYESHISGPLGVAYGGKDVVEVIKTLIKFTKDYPDMLVIKGGVVDNQYFELKGLEELAKLPAKEVLLARLVGQINAPLSRFAMVMNGSLQKLVCVMNAIAKKKEEQSPKQ
jgi:large subunit ribosomal protein L10